jgi:hypothetical protein
MDLAEQIIYDTIEDLYDCVNGFPHSCHYAPVSIIYHTTPKIDVRNSLADRSLFVVTADSMKYKFNIGVNTSSHGFKSSKSLKFTEHPINLVLRKKVMPEIMMPETVDSSITNIKYCTIFYRQYVITAVDDLKSTSTCLHFSWTTITYDTLLKYNTQSPEFISIWPEKCQ